MISYPEEGVMFLLNQTQHFQHFAALVDSTLDRLEIKAGVISLIQDFFHNVFKVYRILRSKKNGFNLSSEGGNRSRLFAFPSAGHSCILGLEAFPIVRTFRDASDKPASLQDIHQIVDSALLDGSIVEQIFSFEFALFSGADPLQEEETELFHEAFLFLDGCTVVGAVLLEDDGGEGSFHRERGRRGLDRILWQVFFFKRVAACQICFHDQCAILVLNQSELIQHSSFLNSNFVPSVQVDTDFLSISPPRFWFC